MGDRLATIDTDRKLGGGLCPFQGGELGIHLTQFFLRAEAYLLAKFHLDPSSGLATIDMGRGLYGRRQPAPVNFESGGCCTPFRGESWVPN